MINFTEAFTKKYYNNESLKMKSNDPVLTTAQVSGRLALNTAARQLLGLKNKDTIFIFDLQKGSINERLFITKGFEFEGMKVGMAIRNDGIFNNVGAYNTIITSGSLNLESNILLVAKGYIRKDSSGKCRATKRVIMRLRRFVEQTSGGSIIDLFSPAPGVMPQPIYQLIDWQEIEKE